MSVFTEATGDPLDRTVEMDWLAEQPVGDSTLLAWTLTDTYRDEETPRSPGTGCGTACRPHRQGQCADRRHRLRSQLERKLDLALLHLPLPFRHADRHRMVVQSSRRQYADCDHRAALRPTGFPERFIVGLEEVQDTTAEDFHPWRPTPGRRGVPGPGRSFVRYREDWFRGDMAYGRETTIGWDWEAVNDPAVEAGVGRMEPARLGPRPRATQRHRRWWRWRLVRGDDGRPAAGWRRSPRADGHPARRDGRRARRLWPSGLPRPLVHRLWTLRGHAGTLAEMQEGMAKASPSSASTTTRTPPPCNAT